MTPQSHHELIELLRAAGLNPEDLAARLESGELTDADLEAVSAGKDGVWVVGVGVGGYPYPWYGGLGGFGPGWGYGGYRGYGGYHGGYRGGYHGGGHHGGGHHGGGHGGRR